MPLLPSHNKQNLPTSYTALAIDEIHFFFTVKPMLVSMSAIWNEMIQMMNYLSTTTNLILTMKQMTDQVNIVLMVSENRKFQICNVN